MSCNQRFIKQKSHCAKGLGLEIVGIDRATLEANVVHNFADRFYFQCSQEPIGLMQDQGEPLGLEA